MKIETHTNKSKGPELLPNIGTSKNLGDSEANHQTRSSEIIEIEAQADFGTFKLPKCLICQFNSSLSSNSVAEPMSDGKKKCSTVNHELQLCKPSELEMSVVLGISISEDINQYSQFITIYSFFARIKCLSSKPLI